MLVEKIREPIRVLAGFAGGGAKPISFCWRNRTYQIVKINAQWVDRQTDSFSLHYSVQVGQETYYIRFCSQEVQWWLDEVILDG